MYRAASRFMRSDPGGTLHRGPWDSQNSSPRFSPPGTPRAIAPARACALPPDRPIDPLRRSAPVIAPATRAFRTSVHVVVVGLVALLFLHQPLPSVNRPWCSETVNVGRHLHYLLNFDSPVYLDIAEEPARLFLPHGESRSRQARPLYMLAARVLERPLRDARSERTRL